MGAAANAVGGEGVGAARAQRAGHLFRFAGWPYLFPFPQRPEGLIDTAFDELAGRWLPVLNACDEQGINLCYEIHPSEDLHDGVTFEMFHEHVGHHPRCRVLFDPSHMVLQQLNYLEFIDIYKEVIGMFHVKDAEFNPTGRQGIYGGYQSRIDRAGRFRSLGDGGGRFQRHLFTPDAVRLFGLGGAGVGCCLKTRRTVHAKAQLSFAIALSTSPTKCSTTSPARRSTHSRSMPCLAFAEPNLSGSYPMQYLQNEVPLADLAAEHVYLGQRPAPSLRGGR